MIVVKYFKELVKIKNVLVTALGTMTGTYVAKRFKSRGFFVHAFDMYPREYLMSSSEVDCFCTCPKVGDEGYFEFLLDYCKKNRIEAVIPFIDDEVLLLAQRKDELMDAGILPLVSCESAVSICHDKWQTAEFMKNNYPSIYIKTISMKKGCTIEMPFFIKPRAGRASIGCSKIENMEQFLAYRSTIKDEDDCIVQELCDGDYFSVDVINNHGLTFSIARQELVRNSNGAATVVQIVDAKQICDISEKIAKELNLFGISNFEYIQQKSGEYVCIEINSKMPAGTELSCMGGLDLFAGIIDTFYGANTVKKASKIGKIYARRYEAHEVKGDKSI